MAATITFDDGSGSQTLTPTSTECRFNGWTPLPMTVGERAIAVGDGRGYQWRHRYDYGVSFELPNLANTDEAVIQAFLLHANAYGLFTLTTDDSESNVYTDVQVAPNTLVELSPPDPETLEYTLRLTVVSMATVPVLMRCVY